MLTLPTNALNQVLQHVVRQFRPLSETLHNICQNLASFQVNARIIRGSRLTTRQRKNMVVKYQPFHSSTPYARLKINYSFACQGKVYLTFLVRVFSKRGVREFCFAFELEVT